MVLVCHHQHVQRLLTKYDEFLVEEYILWGTKYLTKVGNIKHELKQFLFGPRDLLTSSTLELCVPTC
jgi:hypothetical protein